VVDPLNWDAAIDATLLERRGPRKTGDGVVVIGSRWVR